MVFLVLLHRILRLMMIRKFFLVYLFALLFAGGVKAQQQPVAEFFAGAELNYADINFTRLYNTLINLTPGVKVHMGSGWEFAAQMQIPLVNEGYAKRYNCARLSMMNFSKELRFTEARQYVKLTAGLFGFERYGLDVYYMFPITSWLMVNARGGLTNHWAFGYDFHSYTESDFETKNWTLTGMLGASFWLDPWKTELRGMGGRYLNEDYGIEGEIIRHFNHCSVSVFAQLHDKSNTKLQNRRTVGFRVVMMIPPYKKHYKSDVIIRPASNFRLTYNAQADGYSMRKYTIDPEENERYYLIRIPWGTGNYEE